MSKLLFTFLFTIIVTTDVFAEVAAEDQTQPWKVINYWSITCAPCRIEIPELNKLAEELSTQNVNVLGVNYDEDDRTRTLKLAARMGITFPTLTQAVVDALGLQPPNVLPTTYILSPHDQLKATLAGVQTGESIKTKLSELLAIDDY